MGKRKGKIGLCDVGYPLLPQNSSLKLYIIHYILKWYLGLEVPHLFIYLSVQQTSYGVYDVPGTALGSEEMT